MPAVDQQEVKPYEAVFAPSGFPAGNASSGQIAENTEICCHLNIAVNNDDTFDGYLPALNTAYTVKNLLKWAEDNQLTGSGKPVIGVLLRKFTRIQEYLQVFQDFNIPFEIIGGKNLFQQQEAFDLFHFISVLINPRDDLALVGLLRSPFFTMSDRHIHPLAQRLHSEDTSVFNFMENSPEFMPVAEEIKEWINTSRNLSASKLLSGILYEQKKLFGYCSETNARQRIANLEKIIALLEDWELDGATIHTIHELFKYHMDEGIQTAQADIPSSALVQIMTIHKAKGLEFPAVVIPEMNGTINADKSTIMHGKIPIRTSDFSNRIEVGITLSDESGESQKTNLLNYIKAVSEDELTAEEKAKAEDLLK